MSSKPDQVVQSLLTNNIEELKKLLSENSDGSKKYAAEITTILFWIAMNHPEILANGATELQDISVKHLYFQGSWESPDKVIPTEVLTTLFSSKICREMKSFCGYISAQALSNFPEHLWSVGFSISKLTDAKSLIRELHCRRERYLRKLNPHGPECLHKFCLLSIDEKYIYEEHVTIHLRCGEVDLKNLTPLPESGIFQSLLISNVSDHDIYWVVQAFTALRPKKKASDPFFYVESLLLNLPNSKLTSIGLEGLAKGFYEAPGLHVVCIGVESPYINNNTEVPWYRNTEVPRYRNTEDFNEKIKYKYDLDFMFYDEDERMSWFIDPIMDFRNKSDVITNDLCEDFPESCIPKGCVLSPISPYIVIDKDHNVLDIITIVEEN